MLPTHGLLPHGCLPMHPRSQRVLNASCCPTSHTGALGLPSHVPPALPTCHLALPMCRLALPMCRLALPMCRPLPGILRATHPLSGFVPISIRLSPPSSGWTTHIVWPDHPHHPARPPTSSSQTTHIVRPDHPHHPARPPTSTSSGQTTHIIRPDHPHPHRPARPPTSSGQTTHIVWPDHPHCLARPPTLSGQTTHIVWPNRLDPPDLTGLCLILFMDSRMFSFYNRMFLHALSLSTFYLHLDPRSSILISVTYPCLSDSGSH